MPDPVDIDAAKRVKQSSESLGGCAPLPMDSKASNPPAASSSDTPRQRVAAGAADEGVETAHEGRARYMAESFASADVPNSAVSSMSARGRLSSITCVMFAISAVVVVSCVVIVFVATISLIQRDVDGFANALADSAANSTSFAVQLHYRKIQQTAEVLGNLADRDPMLVLREFDNPTLLVQWFAARLEALGVHLVLFNTSDIGYVLGPYGVFPVAVDFAHHRPGHIVVQACDARRNVSRMGYAPVNLAPRAVLGSAPYNFTYTDVEGVWFNLSTRPYTALFSQRFQWSQPYVGVLKRTSAIGIGGPFFFDSAGSRALAGTFSLHGYAVDIAAQFARLGLSAHARAVLFDFDTQVFLGGNVADNSTVERSDGVILLTHLEQLRDPVLAPVFISGGATLLECSDVCGYVFDRSDRSLITSVANRWAFSLFADYDLVRVAAVRDSHGLNLRLVIVIPSTDFVSEIRRSASQGMILSGVVLSSMMIVLSIIIYVLLEPLRTAGDSIVSIGKRQVRDVVHDVSAAIKHGDSVFAGNRRDDSVGCTRRLRRWVLLCLRSSVTLAEVEMIQKMLHKLRTEMTIIRSFVPADIDDFSMRALPARRPSSPGLRLAEGAGSSRVWSDDANSSEPRLLATPGVARETAVITYAVGDILSFDKLRTTLLPSKLTSIHGVCLQIVQSATESRGGSVSSFYGDKFFLHFNADKRLKGHAAAAVKAAVDIHNMFRSCRPALPEIRIGIATSRALCGRMCPRCLQSFHVVGECVNTAFYLAMAAKDSGYPALMTCSTTRLLRNLSGGLFAQHVGLEILPYDESPTIISTPVAWSTLERKGILPRGGGPRITEAHKIHEAYELSNAAYDAVAEKAFARAEQLMQLTPFRPDDHWLLQRLDTHSSNRQCPL